MKFNFKKIASVLAATIMLGSTVSFAAAAWPAPFVSEGANAAAVVYGASAPATAGDKAAAINIGAELDKSITVTTGAGTVSGDNFKLAKSTDMFNLGNAMNAFYSSIDEEQLSKVLAMGIYTNDANDEFDYEQAIKLGGKTLTHFLDSDFNDNKPIIGFNLNAGDDILNYTIDFTPAAKNTVAFGAGTSTAPDTLETSDLTMLGVSYYIQKVEAVAGSGVKMTLLDNANTATVTEGETQTVTVGSDSYSVVLNFVDSAHTILEVNGVKTNKLAEGDVFKIATDTYVSVKNILYNAKESGISSVEFSIGSGKIVIENTKELEKNGEAISDSTDMILTAYITNTSTAISQIKLAWTVDDDFWVAPGSELLLPGFETIKFSMGGFNAPKQETTTLKADGDDKFTMWTTIKDGDLKLPLLYMNTGVTGVLGIGEKATHKLVTKNSTTKAADGNSVTLDLNLTENSYFVVTWINSKDYESFAYEIESIQKDGAADSGKNETTLKNMVDSDKNVILSEVGKDKDISGGNINIKLLAANKANKIATLNLTAGTGDIFIDRLVTKEGLQIRLPYDVGTEAPTAALGEINVSAEISSWMTNVSEEDKDGTVNAGKSFTINSTVNANDGMEVTALANGITTATTYETVDGSRIYEGYAASDLATKVVWDKPTSGANELDIIYSGDQSYADVYIAESAAVVGATKDSVKVVTDAEVESVKDKNLIVVGGSCINTVAAKILGSETAICGDAWASQTGAGPGKYLIQVAASPVNAEKIAMLVAGYETADTANAVAVVTSGKASTEVGKTVYPIATTP